MIVTRIVEGLRSAAEGARGVAERIRHLDWATIRAQIRPADWLVAARRVNARIPWKKIFRTIGLAAAILVIGFLLGGMLVVLPPMAPIGLLAIPMLVLIWATPELRNVPVRALSKAFYAVVFAEAIIPYYLAVQIPGLPWLTIRRLFVVTLLVLFGVCFAGSSKVRSRIRETFSANKGIYYCLLGYCSMCVISIATARNPAEALSQLAEFSFNWFVPAFACVIAVKSLDDVRYLFKLLAICFIFITLLGLADFIMERNLVLSIIPTPILNRMMEAYPNFQEFVNLHPVRNGHYRALSVFVEPLSYGEFSALVAPIAAYYIFHAEKAGERALGFFMLFEVMLNLFVSGARGGSVAFLASMPVYFVLWIIRTGRFNPRSMLAPLGGAIAFMATSSLIGLIFAWKRLHDMVLGGGDTASSDMARWEQARLAWPKILANPVTGYGIGNSVDVIGYMTLGGKPSVDSSILTLVVETGVPGLLLFFGMLGFSAWAMARLYVSNKDRISAVGATLACSFMAYGIYRLVLSQRDNQWLIFIFIGVASVVLKLAADRVKQAKPESPQAAPASVSRPFMAPAYGK